MLVFIWSSSVVKPVSILVVIIPVLELLVSLVISWVLLVSSVPVVVYVVTLSVV